MKYAKVGQIALRRPDGSFCEAVPIYKDIDERDAAVAQSTGRDIAEIFLEKMEKVGAVHKKLRGRSPLV